MTENEAVELCKKIWEIIPDDYSVKDMLIILDMLRISTVKALSDVANLPEQTVEDGNV